MPTVKNVSSEDNQPYLLDKNTWNKRLIAAKNGLRGNCVPERVTKSTGAQMTGYASEIHWLQFGIQSDRSEKLTQVQQGILVLDKEESDAFIEELETPITFDDVLAKARKQRLI
jgi:hypothetical protein